MTMKLLPTASAMSDDWGLFLAWRISFGVFCILVATGVLWF